MKVRIKGNTIRIRLTKTEVDYFKEFKRIVEKTEFGNSTLRYGVYATPEAKQFSASLENNNLIYSLPENVANSWASTSQVGLSAEMEVGNGKKLFLLLEKDFKCLDETNEDQNDNYENPLAHLHK